VGYLRLFTDLDIPISKPKTLESQEGFEFCKRRSREGKEVTPLPMKALLNSDLVYAMYEALRVALHYVEPSHCIHLFIALNARQPSLGFGIQV